MPSPGPGGSQSSLAGMVVSWLTSQFRTGPKQQPKKGAPIALYRLHSLRGGDTGPLLICASEVAAWLHP